MTPKFIERIRESNKRRKSHLEKSEIAALERRVKQLDDDLTHRINVNLTLWQAMKKLPGGVEAARKITVDANRSL